jgi:uncharacterized membrane protein YsdA (DUF1294 family)
LAPATPGRTLGSVVPAVFDPPVLNLFGIILLAWYALCSMVAFVVFAWDKVKSKSARSGADRVPERTLFILMWIGGTFGAVPAMVLLRHKTRKPAFAITGIFAAAVQLALLGWLGTG